MLVQSHHKPNSVDHIPVKLSMAHPHIKIRAARRNFLSALKVNNSERRTNTLSRAMHCRFNAIFAFRDSLIKRPGDISCPIYMSRRCTRADGQHDMGPPKWRTPSVILIFINLRAQIAVLTTKCIALNSQQIISLEKLPDIDSPFSTALNSCFV